jgi:predicted RNA-binding protein with PUA-like domain
MPNHWLVKSEPAKYAWDALVKDGSTRWDGVRNAQARNSLREMKPGDLVLYYHSQEGREIVGVARVAKPAYPDPTADDPQWLAVDLEPLCPLVRAVTLAELKADPDLRNLALIRQSRLSVMPVERGHFTQILKLAKTKLPKG